jgi:hypothetical protein
MFYFQPREDILQLTFQQGTYIGVAQDVTQRYPATNMQPHVHLQIEIIDPFLLLEEN